MGCIGISLLTLCILNDAACPQCTTFFYEILLLKLSLQITGQNETWVDDGEATFICRKFRCHCELSDEPLDYFEAWDFLSGCNIRHHLTKNPVPQS